MALQRSHVEGIVRGAHRLLYPMRYYTPHRGQKPFHYSTKPIIVLSGGNRSGKSEASLSEGAWAVTGTHPVKGKYRPSTANDPFLCRFISHPDALREVIQTKLKLKLPPGSIKRSVRNQSGKYDDFWECRGKGWWSLIDFKSCHQDPGMFASVPRDLILYGEPVSEAIRNENSIRIGTSKYGLREIFDLTPLEGANWMWQTFFEGGTTLGTLNNVDYFRMSIYDNAVSNGGYLPDTEVDRIVEDLKRDPLEYRARVFGDFILTYRNIIPNYDPTVHIVNPSGWSWWVDGYRPLMGVLYISCDPHDARPDFLQYWVVVPDGTFYLIDESPNYMKGRYQEQPAELIREGPVEPEVLMREMITTAKHIGLPVGGLGMDPHFGRKTYRDSHVQVVEMFNKAINKIDVSFPKFRLVVPEKDDQGELHAGHKSIRQLLYYDKNRKIMKGNSPGMFLTELCQNTHRALLNYRNELPSDREGADAVSEKPQELYKHYMDCIRYFLAMNPQYYDPAAYGRALEPPSAAAA